MNNEEKIKKYEEQLSIISNKIEKLKKKETVLKEQLLKLKNMKVNSLLNKYNLSVNELEQILTERKIDNNEIKNEKI